MAETTGKRFNRMIHRWRLELDNACRVNPNLYRWWLDLDNACHVNPILYRWWLYLVYVGRLYQADNSKRRVRRLTHQFGTCTDAGLDAAKRQSAQNPCPIRLSAGGGGAKSAPLNTLRRTKSALTHRTTAKAQLPPTGHPELVSGSPTKFNTS